MEYQGRLDLGFYAICGAPEIRLEELGLGHEPVTEKEGEEAWDDVLRRATLINDDGHSAKLIRSLALGEKVSSKYEWEGLPGFEIRGKDWLRIANMGTFIFAIPSLFPRNPRLRYESSRLITIYSCRLPSATR